VTISIPDLEQRAALGWRAPEEERLGDWLLRAGGGFTGRANSALAAGDPGGPVDQAEGTVRDWYEARSLPAMICVPYPAGQPQAVPLDRFLAERGWGMRPGAATVMTAPAGQVARVAEAVAAVPVDVDPEPDEAWLALYHYRGQQGLPPIARRVLTSAPWQAFASIRADGQTIAIGRVAAAEGWAGLTAIEVEPAHRRRGLATVVTATLAGLAAARRRAPLPPSRGRQRSRPRALPPHRLRCPPWLPLPDRPAALERPSGAPGTAGRPAGRQKMSTTSGGPPADVGTLVFDVLGTVVDEAGSVAAETARALAAAGAGPSLTDQLAVDWSRQVNALTSQVAVGEAPWRSNDALRRDALQAALRAAVQAGLPPALADDQAPAR